MAARAAERIFDHAGALFYARRRKNSSSPFEALLNLLLFFQNRHYFKLWFIGSGSAPLLFLAKGCVLCLETDITLSILLHEGGTNLVKSGAPCLLSKVSGYSSRHHNCMKISLRLKVFWSFLEPICPWLVHRSRWSCEICRLFFFFYWQTIFPAASVYFQSGIKADNSKSPLVPLFWCQKIKRSHSCFWFYCSQREDTSLYTVSEVITLTNYTRLALLIRAPVSDFTDVKPWPSQVDCNPVPVLL